MDPFIGSTTISLTTEELQFLSNIVGLLYREGGSCSPRPEGWTDEEWELRSSLYRRLNQSAAEARMFERQVRDECGCPICVL